MVFMKSAGRLVSGASLRLMLPVLDLGYCAFGLDTAQAMLRPFPCVAHVVSVKRALSRGCQLRFLDELQMLLSAVKGIFSLCNVISQSFMGFAFVNILFPKDLSPNGASIHR